MGVEFKCIFVQNTQAFRITMITSQCLWRLLFIVAEIVNLSLAENWIHLCGEDSVPECRDYCEWTTSPAKIAVINQDNNVDDQELVCAALSSHLEDPNMSSRLVHIYSQAESDCIVKFLHSSK